MRQRSVGKTKEFSNRLAWSFIAITITVGVLGTAAAEARTKTVLGLVVEGQHSWRRQDLDAQAINAASSAFLNTRHFEIAERKELAKIFEEKSLKDVIGGESGNLFDTWGLDVIGFVSYKIDQSRKTPTPTYSLTVRLASVSSGELLGTFDSTRPSVIVPTSLAIAGDHLSANLREAFPAEGMIIKVINKKDVVVDMGSSMGLKAGDTLMLISNGEPIIHPETGEVYPGEEMPIGKLRVKNVGLRTAVCKVRKSQIPVEVAQRVRYQGQFRGFKRFIPKSVQRLFQQKAKEEIEG